MAFFQQVCQLVAVLGMHHHLEVLWLDSDCLVATQLSLYRPVLDGAPDWIWHLYSLSRLADSFLDFGGGKSRILFQALIDDICHLIDADVFAHPVSLPLQTAMNLQNFLLIVHRVNGFDIVEPPRKRMR